MKKHPFYLVTLLTALLCLTACKDPVETTIVTVNTTIDTSIDGLQLTEGTYTFENVSNAKQLTLAYPNQSIELEDGLYNLSFIGKGVYRHDSLSGEVEVQGVRSNLAVSGGNYTVELTVFVRNVSDGDFVIAELFLPGTFNEAGKQYNGDQYVRIYNNSDKVLYADGLVFMESAFMTTSKYKVVDPDIMNEAMAINTVAVVPGNGQDHPVQPGESIILCDNAINHKEANPNSIDLSKADFEWYFPDSKLDVDNPEVENLSIYYCYTKTIWILNKQGNRAYAIGRLPQGMTADRYIAEYKYDYTYEMDNGTVSKPQSQYKFPNEWIVDAVNVGANNEWQWNVTASKLDMGHTYIGQNNTIAENIGKCVLRKVSHKDGSREVLLDTDNSSVDFTPAATPTLFTK
ncbi:MAG: DUF4876 domain-containing protein [Bacteroidales bacterium]|nr:DUF4876 domain-containing protein [Bacteroidales bacterium]